MVRFQVYWCSGVEQCLAAPSPSAALAQYLLTCTAQLGALTRLVRGSLPDLHRRTLAALITIDVHARDIVDNLIRSGPCQVPHCMSITGPARLLHKTDAMSLLLLMWCIMIELDACAEASKRRSDLHRPKGVVSGLL